MRLDFLPYLERTVKPYGIVVDQITYYADVLRRWVNVGNPAHKRAKFIVRRDPRDISMIYFYDPELQSHFPIRYRNTAHPPISVWELREIRHQLKEHGNNHINEDLIFRTYAHLQDIEAQARRSTRATRRHQQQRREHAGVHPFSLFAPLKNRTRIGWESDLKLYVGHVVGLVELTDCIEYSNSPWFFGEFGFVCQRAIAFTQPFAFRGVLGFFEVPDDLLLPVNS